MLTTRQRLVFDALDRGIRETGIPPSYREMARATGIKSHGNIHDVMGELEARGFIRRLHGKARAIEVLRRPGGPQAHFRAHWFRWDADSKRLVPK